MPKWRALELREEVKDGDIHLGIFNGEMIFEIMKR